MKFCSTAQTETETTETETETETATTNAAVTSEHIEKALAGYTPSNLRELNYKNHRLIGQIWED